MANPFKEAENKKKVPPGGEHKPVVKDPVVEEPKKEEAPAPTTAPTPAENPFEVEIEQKPEGKSYGFYLSIEAAQKLEKFAKQNKCSKSKALDALLRKLP